MLEEPIEIAIEIAIGIAIEIEKRSNAMLSIPIRGSQRHLAMPMVVVP